MNKIACIQMTSSSNVNDNLIAAGELIAESADNRANLIVLPEMFTIIGKDLRAKLHVKETIGHGIVQDFLKAAAQKNDVWIIGGTIPIACSNPNKVRAACIVYNNHGEMVARYDKIHLFDVTLSNNEVYDESSATEPGNQITIVDTPCGKVGLAVCYDIRFPELFRSLVNSGAEIFVLPAAFAVKTGIAHWNTLLRARAIENFCYIAAAGQAGLHQNGRQTYGHSMIVDPWGEIIAEKLEPVPGVIYAEIDLNHLREIRKAMPVLQHQKISFNPL